MDWAAKNPKQAAAIAAGLVCAAAPAAVVAAPLAALGFGASGPIAGGAAAAFQSLTGIQVAGGVFATMQSAAMGGYGAPVLAAGVKTLGAAGAVLGAWNPLGGRRA